MRPPSVQWNEAAMVALLPLVVLLLLLVLVEGDDDSDNEVLRVPEPPPLGLVGLAIWWWCVCV